MKRRVFKWLGIIVGGLVGLLALCFFCLYLEDQSYDRFEFSGIPNEDRKALLLTWSDEKGDEFWADDRSGLAPLLESLHQERQIVLTIPLSHSPLKHDEHVATWNRSLIVLLARSKDNSQIVDQIVEVARSNAGALRSIDLLRLQNGLDMFYPLKDGKARESDLVQSIEYVFSKPEGREAYYQDQYKWSGPAMADLYRRDKTGRFIGFELDSRLFGSPGMPTWDLVHLFGFTPWQSFKASFFFFSTWNEHARRVFGPDSSFRRVMQDWDKIRLKLQTTVTQSSDSTLQELPQ